MDRCANVNRTVLVAFCGLLAATPVDADSEHKAKRASSHEDQDAIFEEFRQVAPAIEEGLRFETPLTTVQRFTTEDTVLQGIKMPARSAVDLCIGSANRDRHRWERSEDFDIFRKAGLVNPLMDEIEKSFRPKS